MAKSPCTTEHPELTFVFGQTLAVRQAVNAAKLSGDDCVRIETVLRNEIGEGGGFPDNYTFILEAIETCLVPEETDSHGDRAFSVEVQAGNGSETYARAKMATMRKTRTADASTGEALPMYTHPETLGDCMSNLCLLYGSESIGAQRSGSLAPLFNFIEGRNQGESTDNMPDEIANLLTTHPQYACWKGGLSFTISTWLEGMLDGGPPDNPSTSIDIRCAFSGAPQDDDLGKFLPRLLSAALNELLKIWYPNYTIQNNLNSERFVEKAKGDPALREALIYLADHGFEELQKSLREAGC